MPGEEELLTTEEAAEWLKIPAATLKWWRHSKTGPPYVVKGTKYVRYRRSALEEWAAASEVSPTLTRGRRPRTVPFPPRSVAQ